MNQGSWKNLVQKRCNREKQQTAYQKIKDCDDFEVISIATFQASLLEYLFKMKKARAKTALTFHIQLLFIFVGALFIVLTSNVVV